MTARVNNHDLLGNRRSTRAFDRERPVERVFEDVEAWQKAFDCLAPGDHPLGVWRSGIGRDLCRHTLSRRIAQSPGAAVGQRADIGTLGRDLYRRGITARRREPIGSRFFDGQWERPVTATRGPLPTPPGRRARSS